jgi:hypothetical protein
MRGCGVARVRFVNDPIDPECRCCSKPSRLQSSFFIYVCL